MEKTYPFSVAKHAHDIEFFHNRLYNIMRDMEDGETPMNNELHDKICDLYYGDLQELYLKMFDSRDGRVVFLTGKQIGLAKQIVLWASNSRASSLIKAGKYEFLQYC